MTKLSFLHRRYLRGSDLTAPLTVEIIAINQVTVQPHPKAEPVVKWCLWVKDLPQDTPNGILIGPRGSEQLIKIHGDIDHTDLVGKKVVIYPQPIQVAGVKKIAIFFRSSPYINGLKPQ